MIDSDNWITNEYWANSCSMCLQQGQTALYIAQKLGYISVVEVLKNVTETGKGSAPAAGGNEEKYKVVAPETMQENFMSDSEDEGGKVPVDVCCFGSFVSVSWVLFRSPVPVFHASS